MTNYNERLADALRLIDIEEDDEPGACWIDDNSVEKAKQAITSLTKELLAEARIDELKHLINDDGIWYQDMTRQFPQKIRLDERIKELEV